MDQLKNIEIKQMCRTLKKPTLVFASPDTPIGEAMRLMANNKILSIPVHSHSNPNNIVNIINILDILEHLVFHREGLSAREERSSTASITQEDFENSVESVMTLDVDRESYRVWNFDVNDTMKGLLSAFSCHVHRVLITDVRNPEMKSMLTQSDLIRFALSNIELLGNVDVNSSVEKLGFKCIHPRLITTRTTDPVLKAFQLMVEMNCHAFPVLDENNKLVANLSASDLRGLTPANTENLDLNVIDYIKAATGNIRTPITCTKDTSLLQVMKDLVENRVHRVWVVDDGKLCVLSVITLSDIIGKLLEF